MRWERENHTHMRLPCRRCSLVMESILIWAANMQSDARCAHVVAKGSSKVIVFTRTEFQFLHSMIFFFVLFYDVLFSSAPVCGFLFDIKRIFFWFDMRIVGIDDRCLRRHCAFAHDTENQLLYRVTSECVIDELINTLMSELGRVWGKRREIIRKYFIELCISVCMTVCDVEEELLCSFSNVTRIAAFV